MGGFTKYWWCGANNSETLHYIRNNFWNKTIQRPGWKDHSLHAIFIFIKGANNSGVECNISISWENGGMGGSLFFPILCNSYNKLKMEIAERGTVGFTTKAFHCDFSQTERQCGFQTVAYTTYIF